MVQHVIQAFMTLLVFVIEHSFVRRFEYHEHLSSSTTFILYTL